jgi:hypothetical protein
MPAADEQRQQQQQQHIVVLQACCATALGCVACNAANYARSAQTGCLTQTPYSTVLCALLWQDCTN